MVQNEQFRKYDMNELERMLRMKEQEWSQAADETSSLCDTHEEIMRNSKVSEPNDVGLVWFGLVSIFIISDCHMIHGTTMHGNPIERY